MRQFQSSMAYDPLVATLDNIKQRNKETLHDYFRRFNAKVPQVKGSINEAIKNFLIVGLRKGFYFWKNIQAHEPRTLQDFYQQTKPYKIVETPMVDLQRGNPSPDSYRYRNRKWRILLTPEERTSPSPKNDRARRERTPAKNNVEVFFFS